MLAATAATWAGLADARPAPVCGPAHARTLRQDGVARVYEMSDPANRSFGGRDFYACARDGRRDYYLGWRWHSPFQHVYDVGPIALRGPVIAWNLQFDPRFEGESTVTVKDLRTGRRLHRWDDGGDICAGAMRVTRLIAAADGSAAWIDGYEIGDCSIVWQVRVAARGSYHGHVVDAGRAIDPRFLRADAGRLHWRDADKPRSAPFS